MKKIFLIFLCLSYYLANAQQSFIDTASIMKSLDSLGGIVQKAHDTHDKALLASTWAEDGIFMVAGSPIVSGRDNIVKKITSMPSLPRDAVLKMNIVEVQVLNAGWAYVLGTDSIVYTPKGKKPVTKTSNFFVLVKKSDAGWQTYRETLVPNQE